MSCNVTASMRGSIPGVTQPGEPRPSPHSRHHSTAMTRQACLPAIKSPNVAVVHRPSQQPPSPPNMAASDASQLFDLETLLTAPPPSVHAAEDLIISCGCVGVDLAAHKVVIIRQSQPTAAAPIATILPKGRKNIGEDLLTAALRETFEETGFRFAALPLPVATRATRPSGSGEFDVVRDLLNCEPAAVSAYTCIHTGAFKLVFWFAAQGDSAALPVTGTRELWEEGMSAQWVDAAEAAAQMTFESDGKVVKKILGDIRGAGYDI
jgi:8-oxo-dGTP pyrophosphatase MutT (NUDIX family)